MLYDKVFSVKTNEKTGRLLEQMYLKMITDQGRLMLKSECFEAIIKNAAEREGVTV
jgi:hypothetical protein